MIYSIVTVREVAIILTSRIATLLNTGQTFKVSQLQTPVLERISWSVKKPGRMYNVGRPERKRQVKGWNGQWRKKMWSSQEDREECVCIAWLIFRSNYWTNLLPLQSCSPMAKTQTGLHYFKVKKALYSHLVGWFSQIAKWPKMYKMLSFLYFCWVSFDWFDMVNQYRYSILQYNATSTII